MKPKTAATGVFRQTQAAAARLLAATAIVAAAAACSDDRPQMTPPSVGQLMNDATQKTLERASKSRVFFTHQSVGSNTLEGLGALLQASGIRWPVVAAGEDAVPDGPALIHATPGQNGDPKSKMDGFAVMLATLKGTRPELAFMKLCYVDVTYETDIDAVFSHYEKAVAKLKAAYPDIVFGHVTVPLATRLGGIKARLKRSVGVSVKEDLSNARRTAYNRRLREVFATDPLLDLERVESTRPDGSREQDTLDGATVYALAPEYASDPWGHLNGPGSQLAARELVRFVAEGVSRREASR